MSKLGIEVDRPEGGRVVLRLSGALDGTTAEELRPTVDGLVAEKPGHVAVDLAELELIDSSGTAALVGIYKRVRAEGGEVEVVHAKGQPEAILKLLRMDKVFLR